MHLSHQSPLPLSLDAARGSSAAASPAAAVRPDPILHLVLLLLCATVVFLAATLTVQGQTQVVVPFLGQPLPELCLARRLTGVACPGCGLTRCFISLAHGDLFSAWSFNPAGILLFGIVAAQPPLRALQLWRIRRQMPEVSLSFVPHALWVAFAIAIFAQWALRLLGIGF